MVLPALKTRAILNWLRKRRGWGCALLLVVATLWAYRNSYTAPFIFDDGKSILQRESLHFLPALSTVMADTKRPVYYLSLAANYAAGGEDVRGYHVVNLGIHLVAGLALFDLTFRLLKVRGNHPVLRRAALGIAWASALLWLLHPLQTASVTYISQRCESMMGMFYLLSLNCLVRGGQAARRISRRKQHLATASTGFDSSNDLYWYAAALVTFALGMGSKEVMATMPVVALLLDRCFLARSWRQVFARRWLFYAAFSPGLVWLVWRLLPTFVPNAQAVAGFGIEGMTSWEYLRSQPGVILHYLRLVFAPNAQCFDYMWPVASTFTRIAIPGTIVAGLLAASLFVLFWKPRVGFLAMAFFVILAPTSSFVPIIDLAFEHRMYLPLAPVIILTVCGFMLVTERWCVSPESARRARLTTLVFAALALTICTGHRNRLFADPSRMWANVLEQAPHNWRAHHNLAATLKAKGNLMAAQEHYEQAVRLYPYSAKSHFKLAELYRLQGEREQAEKHFARGLEFDPHSDETRGVLEMRPEPLGD